MKKKIKRLKVFRYTTEVLTGKERTILNLVRKLRGRDQGRMKSIQTGVEKEEERLKSRKLSLIYLIQNYFNL